MPRDPRKYVYDIRQAAITYWISPQASCRPDKRQRIRRFAKANHRAIFWWMRLRLIHPTGFAPFRGDGAESRCSAIFWWMRLRLIHPTGFVPFRGDGAESGRPAIFWWMRLRLIRPTAG